MTILSPMMEKATGIYYEIAKEHKDFQQLIYMSKDIELDGEIYKFMGVYPGFLGTLQYSHRRYLGKQRAAISQAFVLNQRGEGILDADMFKKFLFMYEALEALDDDIFLYKWMASSPSHPISLIVPKLTEIQEILKYTSYKSDRIPEVFHQLKAFYEHHTKDDEKFIDYSKKIVRFYEGLENNSLPVIPFSYFIEIYHLYVELTEIQANRAKSSLSCVEEHLVLKKHIKKNMKSKKLTSQEQALLAEFNDVLSINRVVYERLCKQFQTRNPFERHQPKTLIEKIHNNVDETIRKRTDEKMEYWELT